MKEWFKARNIWYGAFAALTDAEAGRLAKALWTYTATGEQVELSGNERGCFAMIVYTLQQDEAENSNLSEVRRLAGLAGAEAKQAKAGKGKQTEANEANADNKNKSKNTDKETPLKGSKEKPLARFAPPTVEEVAQYCRERGNGINPQTFIDFYSSKGWRVGNTPMKDWKACVRTWEQRDEKPAQPRVLRAQNYEQREYKESEMAKVLGVDDMFTEVAG